ncbi:unnamed protein product, partial [marine sediment metagenome]
YNSFAVFVILCEQFGQIINDSIFNGFGFFFFIFQSFYFFFYESQEKIRLRETDPNFFLDKHTDLTYYSENEKVDAYMWDDSPYFYM